MGGKESKLSVFSHHNIRTLSPRLSGLTRSHNAREQGLVGVF